MDVTTGGPVTISPWTASDATSASTSHPPQTVSGTVTLHPNEVETDITSISRGNGAAASTTEEIGGNVVATSDDGYTSALTTWAWTDRPTYDRKWSGVIIITVMSILATALVLALVIAIRRKFLQKSKSRNDPEESMERKCSSHRDIEEYPMDGVFEGRDSGIEIASAGGSVNQSYTEEKG